MHNAPSVDCLMGRSVLGLGLTLALWLGAFLVSLFWLGQSPRLGLEHAALILVFGMAAWMIVRLAGVPSAGQLHWNGRQWTWARPGREMAGMAFARLDGQSWMLIEFIADDSRSVWLWLRRGVDDWQWQTLRQAIRAGAQQRRA